MSLNLIANGNDRLCFILIECVQIISSALTAILTFKLFRKLYGPQPWLAAVCLTVSLLLTVLIFLGMETVVVIPLYLFFAIMLLRMLSSKRGFDGLLSGVIGCLTVIARLDTLLLMGIAVLSILSFKESRRNAFAFLLGLSPILIYFFWNRIAFGAWIPVSAEAKQLGGWHFSFRAVETIATPRGALYFLLTIVGFCFSVFRLREYGSERVVRFLIFAFPILFAILLCLKLSWSSYVWYFYPYPIAAAASLFEMLERLPVKLRGGVNKLAFLALPTILVIAAVVLYHDILGLTSKINLVESETRAQPNIYIHALGIKPFTDSHPGRYAMGDRAGLTAFITGKPILQLEGLAADQPLVDSIAASADLLNVLRKYGVHYYIISYPLREFYEHNWHWDLYEPHKQQVQPWAPVMEGKFFAPEVFRYPAPVGALLNSSDSLKLWVTRILDISRASQDKLEGK